MNEEDYPERPSGFLLGKEFIIVLVIVFSGMSFTLGYFVGKNTIGTAAVTPLPAEGTAREARQDAQAPLPVQPPLQQSENAVVPNPVAATEPTVPEKHSGTVVAGAPEALKKSPPATSAAGTDKSSAETQIGERPKVYAVQIGAFKDMAEAKQLKMKFEKKGYKPFISTVKDKKGNKIYKVKTGGFSDKKDAEVLALKLKKTEGLHTYVTTKSE